MGDALRRDRGPFLAEHVREGDYYELSNGHAIECSPGGRQHAQGTVSGAEVLDSDPDVEWTGIDAGFTPEPGTLRAPDVAVGNRITDQDGWIPGCPLLAVEYASIGQDEASLQTKIQDLLAGGTRWVWVVRQVGPRRVEVHEADRPCRILRPGEELSAPGTLRNPVPVEALFDREAAHEVTLRNLLQRRGYADLDGVRSEGREVGLEKGLEKGREEGLALGVARSILAVLESRHVVIEEELRTRILACRDLETLNAWLARAAQASSAEDFLAGKD